MKAVLYLKAKKYRKFQTVFEDAVSPILCFFKIRIFKLNKILNHISDGFCTFIGIIETNKST